MSYKESKLRKLAIDFDNYRARLKEVVDEDGQFKDTDYEFSNITMLLKNISFIAELMNYNINAMASESSAETAKNYQSANVIAEKYNYSPTGFYSASANVDVSMLFSNYSDEENDWFLSSYLKIPKYSTFETETVTPYLNIEQSKEYVKYSTTEDFYFPLTTDYSNLATAVSGDARIVSGAYWDFTDQMSLYNGEFATETFDSNGDVHQIFKIEAVNVERVIDGVTVIGRHKVDYRFVDIYVLDDISGKLIQWTRVDSLSEQAPNKKIYEVRMNGFGEYEVRFGDGVNGDIPNKGSDVIQIKYLVTNMELGEIACNALTPQETDFIYTDSLVRAHDFTTVDMRSFPVCAGYWTSNDDLDAIITNNNNRVISEGEAQFRVKLSQTTASSKSQAEEQLSTIKENYNDFTRYDGQRLGNERSYESFVTRELSEYIYDSYAMNNKEYMNTLMAELYSTSGYDVATEAIDGVISPLEEYREMVDEIAFNNLYMIMVPQSNLRLIHPNKETVQRKFYESRMATTTSVFLTPVYANIGFMIDVTKEDKYKQSDVVLRANIRNYISTEFDKFNVRLGQVIDFNTIVDGIMAIKGVKSINNLFLFQKDYYDFTATDITEILADGIAYDDDGKSVNKINYSFELEKYKFPSLNEIFLNDDASIIIRSVTQSNLPFMDIT